MNRKFGWSLGLAVILVSAMAWAGGPHNVFFSDGERIDLTDMYDGETRYFGAGDHQITVTREGNEIRITMDRGDGDESRTFRCDVDDDDCFVITTGGDDSARVMIRRKSGSFGLLDGGGSENIMVMSAGDHDGNFVFSGGDDPSGLHLMFSADDPDFNWVQEGDHEGHHARVLRMHVDGNSFLRCPEGDTTMHLRKGEDDEGPYYCPRHNLELTKVKGHGMLREMLQKVHPIHEE